MYDYYDEVEEDYEDDYGCELCGDPYCYGECEDLEDLDWLEDEYGY